MVGYYKKIGVQIRMWKRKIAIRTKVAFNKIWFNVKYGEIAKIRRAIQLKYIWIRFSNKRMEMLKYQNAE